MLQISNLDDTKGEWNLNETHIIIPMLDGDILTQKETDKSVTGTITLNSLDSGDQTVCASGLEHSLVIGLDRNLFETHSNKSDLLVIQNSDLKLLSCGTEVRNPVAYALSYIDHDKNEIVWESPSLKEKNKPDWCTSDKPIFEVKDVLNYDDSVQDSSKPWSDELEKNEQISLVDDLTAQTSRIGGNLLIPVEDAINDDKKSEADIIGNSHFIVNYLPTIQSNEAISLLPNHTITIAEKQTNHGTGGKSITKNMSQIQNELLINEIIKKSHPNEVEVLSKSLAEANETMKHYGRTKHIDVIERVGQKEYCSDNDTNRNNNREPNNTVEVEETLSGGQLNEQDEKREAIANLDINSLLPEKNLPLKKQAKMKNTVSKPSWHEGVGISHKNKSVSSNKPQSSINKKLQLSPEISLGNENQCARDSKTTRRPESVRKKGKKKTNGSKQLDNCSKDFVNEKAISPVHQSNQKSGRSKSEIPIIKTKGAIFKLSKEAKAFRSKFNNIFDLLEDLRSRKIVNSSVWQTLHSGLEEMEVDVLKEMKQKSEEESAGQDLSYSAHLKAFALVLHFKQPTAFNYLARMYNKGWPSLDVIKNWKRKVNSQQKLNICQKENKKS
ncbi:hypothetical protein RUM43_003564 [Polyplax serrata]|uniref:THAP9-like helix-turn-helix domain-containing protein n=1 Tax=Polyplax serrata TaxID=468196 RepID=A0AAN8P2K3_POLSC